MYVNPVTRCAGSLHKEGVYISQAVLRQHVHLASRAFCSLMVRCRLSTGLLPSALSPAQC